MGGGGGAGPSSRTGVAAAREVSSGSATGSDSTVSIVSVSGVASAGASATGSAAASGCGCELGLAKMSGLSASMSLVTWTLGSPLSSAGEFSSGGGGLLRLRFPMGAFSLYVTPRGGEELGQDAVHLRVQGQADVAAPDLDPVEVRAQTGAPAHDSVGA